MEVKARTHICKCLLKEMGAEYYIHWERIIAFGRSCSLPLDLLQRWSYPRRSIRVKIPILFGREVIPSHGTCMRTNVKDFYLMTLITKTTNLRVQYLSIILMTTKVSFINEFVINDVIYIIIAEKLVRVLNFLMYSILIVLNDLCFCFWTTKWKFVRIITSYLHLILLYLCNFQLLILIVMHIN